MSEDARSLVRGFLCDDPLQRLTAPKALKHPWLTHTELSRTALAREKASIDVSAKEFPVKMFEAGEYLARQGDVAEVIYLIRCGRVKLQFTTIGRPVPFVVDELGPGNYVGEWSVLEEARVDNESMEALRLGARPDAASVDMGDTEMCPADIIAVEHVEVIIMKRAQMIWILEHDMVRARCSGHAPFGAGHLRPVRLALDAVSAFEGGEVEGQTCRAQPGAREVDCSGFNLLIFRRTPKRRSNGRGTS